jgi:hypothetical protein
LSVLASVSELLCLRLGFGFPIIPKEMISLIENILLAWISSNLFYFVVFLVPEYLTKKDRIKFAYRNLFYILNNIKSLRKDIFKDKKEINQTDYRMIDNYIGESENKVNMIILTMEHIQSIIQRINYTHQLFNPETLRLLDDLQICARSVFLDKDIEIQDEEGNIISIGQNNIKYFKKIFSISMEIEKKEKRNIGIVQKDFPIINEE